MAIEGMKLADSVLRVVTVRELKQQKSAHANSASGTSAVAVFTPSSVRFGAKKKRGGKQ